MIPTVAASFEVSTPAAQHQRITGYWAVFSLHAFDFSSLGLPITVQTGNQRFQLQGGFSLGSSEQASVDYLLRVHLPIRRSLAQQRLPGRHTGPVPDAATPLHRSSGRGSPTFEVALPFV